MSVKILLLILFLYILLVWGVVFYINPEDLFEQGLFYTLAGISSAIVYVIGSLLWGAAARVFRARKARPQAPVVKAPIQQLHPDDIALTQLLAEAQGRLVEAYPGLDPRESLARLPLYLIIGAEGSGKTTMIAQSGMDARRLAGQTRTDGLQPGPTMVANIWLVHNQFLFIEIGGRHFTGDPDRWSKLLETLNSRPPAGLIERWMKGVPPGLDLRAVLHVCDIDLFVAAPDPHQLNHQARFVGERLYSISRIFGRRCPVYTIFTKTDTIRYFPEFFARFSEPEAAQPLGCTLPIPEGNAPQLRDSQTKLLSKAFNCIYSAFTERRTWALYHESNILNRPRIYEFPREFRRIRQDVADYLVEAFHPRDLHAAPWNRGFYFTARREVDAAQLPLKIEPSATLSLPAPGADATKFFKVGDYVKRLGESPVQPVHSGRRETRWMFVKDLFQQVILCDRPIRPIAFVPSPNSSFRQTAASIAAIAAASLLAVIWLSSWAGNLSLIHGVQAAAKGPADQWRNLDELREQVAILGEHDRDRLRWRLGWGLYSGGALYTSARTAYLERLRRMAVGAAHAGIVANLKFLPEQPDPNAPYEPVANQLKAHLMLSGGACSLPAVDLAGVLKENVQVQAPPELVNRQIDFFAAEVAYDNPILFEESPEAKQRALQYLGRVRGLDQYYRFLLSKADAAGAVRLTDKAPDYARVLRGANEVRAAFTPAGWKTIQEAMKSGEFKSHDDDPCLAGLQEAASGGEPLHSAQRIEDRYVKEYIETWRQYLAQFSVIGYNGAADAVNKLEVLEAYKSPLLALLAMTADNTYFPALQSGNPLTPLEKWVPGPAKGILKQRKKIAKQVEKLTGPKEQTLTVGDITRIFKPVHLVVPPQSERWLVEQNKPYIDSLGDLRAGLQAIAQLKPDTLDCAIHKAGDEAYKKAEESVRQLSKGFDPSSPIAPIVEQLLEKPITSAKGLALTNCDPTDAAKGKADKDLISFCAQLQPLLNKYPFGPGPDLSPSDLTAFFAPKTGKIWAFQAQSLKFVAREGANWRQNPAMPEPVASDAVLRFLDKAQQITDAFFPDEKTLHFTFALRPEIPSTSEQVILLKIHGREREFSKQSLLRQEFSWPAASPANADVSGRSGVKGYTSVFSTHPGPWALFRFLGDADERAVGQKDFVWTGTRGASGQRREPLEPPVRMNIVEFPKGVDIFNRKFYTDFRCPAPSR